MEFHGELSGQPFKKIGHSFDLLSLLYTAFRSFSVQLAPCQKDGTDKRWFSKGAEIPLFYSGSGVRYSAQYPTDGLIRTTLSAFRRRSRPAVGCLPEATYQLELDDAEIDELFSLPIA